MRSGLTIPSSNATALSAATRDVFGLLDGRHSIVAVKVPSSPRSETVWMFMRTPGSAMIVTRVRSGPIPAKLSVAAMFTFAGKAAPPPGRFREYGAGFAERLKIAIDARQPRRPSQRLRMLTGCELGGGYAPNRGCFQDIHSRQRAAREEECPSALPPDLGHDVGVEIGPDAHREHVDPLRQETRDGLLRRPLAGRFHDQVRPILHQLVESGEDLDAVPLQLAPGLCGERRGPGSP